MIKKYHNCPIKPQKKILFVLKKRYSYGRDLSSPYGLKNSCSLVSECLEPKGIESKIVEVIDGNFIDREIYIYKPDFVILEAIWCPPYKLQELLRLYPKIQFHIRIHSKFAFLAQERMALEWLSKYDQLTYVYRNLTITANNEDFIEEINGVLLYKVRFAPNCYPIDESLRQDKGPVGDILKIGCFGALRILKNQLFQAICAIYVANEMKKTLHFHINDSSTFEKEGNPILNNLHNIFKDLKHKLIIHRWSSHDEFITLVKEMDVGMQVSFSESYDIVAADFITNGIPIIGSPEIKFLCDSYQADPNNFQEIVNKLKFAIANRWWGFHKINEIKLRSNTRKAIKVWLALLGIK